MKFTMKEKWNYILYLLWFSYLILTGVRMFSQGFLLSRKTLKDVSSCVSLKELPCHEDGISSRSVCNEDYKIRRMLSNPGAPILCSPRRNKVVILMVDALRYDFTEYNIGLEKPLYYQNRLPVMWETLQRWPERSRLLKFMADPPTTTLQRVKALVTGSLPTFIDASSNFAAMELQEDNVLEQLYEGGGRAILLGDDTWFRLMPGKWLRSHAMYSFHTWDLDTVDTEVDSKIYDELKRDDWNLLVAHYLGVDHAGHRYGPNHPEMTRKLNETNSRLRRVMEMLPSNVILYVIGDHGMTESGDHGGESKTERTAAFFAYYSAGLNDIGLRNKEEIQQTDFAPTLSAALGIPPPAPSLGNLVLSVLPKITTTYTLLHLSNTLKQMMKYLVRYGEESQQISLNKLANLINSTRDQISKCSSVTTHDELTEYSEEVRNLIVEIRGVFREVWVEFDSLSMLRALLLLLLAIFLNWLITEGIPMERIPNIFASSFVFSYIISSIACITICYTMFHFKIHNDLEHSIILSTGLISGLVMGALVIMHWDGISQRWYEGRSQFYERFSRAAFVGSATVLTSNSYIIEEGAVLSFLALTSLGLMARNVGSLKAFTLWVACGSVLVLGRSYRSCREEQGDCWTANGGAISGRASRAALVLALGSMAAVVAVARRHIGWMGHVLVLAGLFTCAHWAVGWGTLGSAARSRLLARVAWLVLGVMFVVLWRRDGRGATLPLTVFSLLLYVANTLVLGVTYAPAAALALLSGFLVINLVALLKNRGSTKISLSSRCSSAVACTWALLAMWWWHGAGHHATLAHVRWAAAFHAGDPSRLPAGLLLSGALVFLDLFGIPLMFGAAVPLLVLWVSDGASNTGPRTQLAAVFSLCLKFSLCFAIRVFASAISATIHCRHLMIWGVFTPKLIFEAGACAAALAGAAAGAALAARHVRPPPRDT